MRGYEKKLSENTSKLGKEGKYFSKRPLNVDKNVFKKIPKGYLGSQKIASEKRAWGKHLETMHQIATNVINNICF